MPIYAYRCEECGFAKDVLQKMSEDPLTICPECQRASFKKQVTAAGFQLKGSGWYVTDFRGGNAGSTGAATGTVAAAKDEGKTSNTESAASAPVSSATSDSGSSTSPSSTSTNSDHKAA